MKLFDTDPESNIEFLFSKLANSFEVECQMQITKDGQIAITRKANVPLEKLRNLAQWLDSLWNECPPALIEELGLKFEFSHRASIVDLLKLLGLDSSLAARKQLAGELLYSGNDEPGSAAWNIWLHKQVMRSIAANGGSLPPELRD